MALQQKIAVTKAFAEKQNAAKKTTP